jgi:SAM-dependent methyltransferase
MPASRLFSSGRYEDLAGDAPFRVLPPLPIPTLLERQLDKLRSFYQSASTQPTKGGCFYRKLLASYYRDLIPADSSVLEIGCGGGHLLGLLPNRDVVGIDLSEKQIEAARARVPQGEFHVMAGENLSHVPEKCI